MKMLTEKQNICCEEKATVEKTFRWGSGIDPELAKISLWFCAKEIEHRLNQASNQSSLCLTRISKASVEVWRRKIDTDEVILMRTPRQFKWNHAEDEGELILTFTTSIQCILESWVISDPWLNSEADCIDLGLQSTIRISVYDPKGNKSITCCWKQNSHFNKEALYICDHNFQPLLMVPIFHFVIGFDY